MALAVTTLAGSISASAQALKFTTYVPPPSGAIPFPKFVRVDSEWMQIVDDSTPPTVRLVRGVLGTNAVAHTNLAACAYGLATDLTPNNISGGFLGSPSAQVSSYSVNGPVTIPQLPINLEQLIFLTKPGVCALTLGAPPLDCDGMMLTFSSETAFAHTVTATGLFSTGTAAVNLATFAAQKGATFSVQAASGLWNVIALQNVTMS